VVLYNLKTYQEYWFKYTGVKDFMFSDDYSKAESKLLQSSFTCKYGDYFKTAKYIKELLRKFIEEGVDKILKISLVLEYYKKISEDNIKIKRLKILIYANYLLCWLCVLIISLPSLNVAELWEFLYQIFYDTRETFSGSYFIDNIYDESIP